MKRLLFLIAILSSSLMFGQKATTLTEPAKTMTVVPCADNMKEISMHLTQYQYNWHIGEALTVFGFGIDLGAMAVQNIMLAHHNTSGNSAFTGIYIGSTVMGLIGVKITFDARKYIKKAQQLDHLSY